MVKFLHIATDDKFIDGAYHLFSQNKQSHHDVVIISDSITMNHVKLDPIAFIKSKDITCDNFVKLCRGYDRVVLHSLDKKFVPLVLKAKKAISFSWIGWGFDYYDMMDDACYLPQTHALYTKAKQRHVMRHCARAIKRWWLKRQKIKSIRYIETFSPVLPNEYDMVKTALDQWGINTPTHVSWNYPVSKQPIEDEFKEFKVNGRNILFGNSASFTNNHLDMMDAVIAAKGRDQTLICPLSYGEGIIRDAVMQKGRVQCGDTFQGLVDYLPLSDYMAMLQSCGFVVMNHTRQEAMGNILMMLYGGAKIIMNETSPAYHFLRDNQIHVFGHDGISLHDKIFETPLTAQQIADNKSVVISLWGGKKLSDQTDAFIRA